MGHFEYALEIKIVGIDATKSTQHEKRTFSLYAFIISGTGFNGLKGFKVESPFAFFRFARILRFADFK